MEIYQSKKHPRIAILGGGMAGLSLGYYAKKKGLDFRIYEANNRIGGNSVTLKHGDFLFDLGAHLAPSFLRINTAEGKQFQVFDNLWTSFKKMHGASHRWVKKVLN